MYACLKTLRLQGDKGEIMSWEAKSEAEREMWAYPAYHVVVGEVNIARCTFQ